MFPRDSSIRTTELQAEADALPRNHDLFAVLTDDDASWLAGRTVYQQHPKGRTLYAPGDAAEVLYIMLSGRVNLSRITVDGNKIVVVSLKPPSVFGDMSLSEHHVYGNFAETAEESSFCVISRTVLRELIQRNPDVGMALIADIGYRLRKLHSRVEAVAFSPVSTRLARLLLEEENGAEEVTGFTHQDLAERLGIHRETVSETLGWFRTQQIISIGPKRITLLDRARLAAIART